MKHLAIDLYGTLLDTSSVVPILTSSLSSLSSEDTAKAIATTWRTYQLEYTWRLNSSAHSYLPFLVITELSLKNALHDHGVSSTDSEVSEIISRYESELTVYPDAAKFLDAVAEKSADVVDARVFSNGDGAMVKSALAGNGAEVLQAQMKKGILKEPISVEAVRRFKPARETYEWCQKCVGEMREGVKVEDMVLVSSNPFDVVGAAEMGWETVWVDRQGKGWGDGLGVPGHTVKSLDEVLGVLGL